MQEAPQGRHAGGGDRKQEARTKIQAAASEARRTTAEQTRLDDCHRGIAAWQHWGTYLSERAWGTVREDYSGQR